MVRKGTRKNMRSRRLFALRKKSKRSLRGGIRRKSIRSTRRRIRGGGDLKGKYDSKKICEKARQKRNAAMGSQAVTDCEKELNENKKYYDEQQAINAAASAFYER